MEKKILEIFYSTVLKKDENEVFSRILNAMEEKIVNAAGTANRHNCCIDTTKKQMTVLFDSGIKILARITSHSVRTESLTKMPKVMKIFEETMKEMKESHGFSTELLGTLEPVMYVHICTAEIGLAEGTNKKYDDTAKKLINWITPKKIILFG